MSARRTTGGISLLEMLVALAVLAMIALAFSSVFARSGQIALRGVGASEQLLLSANRNLLQTYSARMLAPSRTRARAFSGSPDRLSAWFAPDFDDAYWPGAPASLSLEYDSVTKSVTLETTGATSEQGSPKTVQLPLASSVRTLVLSYWSVDTGWSDSWDDLTKLPDLIWVEFIAENGAAKPPLALRPGVDFTQSTISLSDLVPPGRPSAP